MVTDILRLVRDGEQTLEPAGVSGMVQEAVDELQGFAAERRVSLRIEGKPVSSSILVNRGLIIVALSDLIRNAIEAIEHDGTVTIRAERDAISKRVRITISDSGPGIAAEILDQVTKSKFTTKVDGTGLGLAVVRRIVDSHFGRLSIGGGNGSGAVVVIELPDSPESISSRIPGFSVLAIASIDDVTGDRASATRKQPLLASAVESRHDK